MFFRTTQKLLLVLEFAFLTVQANEITASNTPGQSLLSARSVNKVQEIKWERAIHDLGDAKKRDLVCLMEEISNVIGKAQRTGDDLENNLIFNKLVENVKKNENPEVRKGCVCCLFPFGKSAIETVKHVLDSDEDCWVRIMAATVLGRIGGEEALDALYSAVQKDKGVPGEGRSIASAAVSAIGDIGGKRASETLMKVWQENLYRGEEMLGAIGTAGDVATLPFIESMLDTGSEIYRDSAMYALGQIASRNRNDSETIKKVRTLARNCLEDKNPKVRVNAASGLALVGEQEDVLLLEELLTDDYKIVRSYVEQGQEKTKEVYPVRDAAREAIDRIKKRFPPEKEASIAAPASYREKLVIADMNETVDANLPATRVTPFGTYTLVAIGVVIAIAVAALFLKKRGGNSDK